MNNPDTTVGELVERLRSDARGADAWRAMDEAADKLSSLQKEIDALRGHLAEQNCHVETRIQDGIEMGAAIWRIALEDVVRENRIALAALSNTGGHNG